jgi:heptosyltransferase-2
LKRILLIQTAFIGDVVLATPVVEKLHQHYPDAEIDFLLRKGHEDLFKGHPFIRKVLTFDKKHKLASLYHLLLKIRHRHYDAVINMHRFTSSGILTAFSGAREKIGFDKNPLSWFYTRKVPHIIGTGQHEINRNLELITHLTDSNSQLPKLYPTEIDYQYIIGWKKNGKYITISPSSVWFTKQWPKEKWIELIRLVPASYPIYLLGGPNDKPICEDILKTSGRSQVYNLSGQLSFLQSAALMKDAHMNYVNDSAPLHFASAMNAPTTAIYCSTIPSFGFGPLSTLSRVAEIKEALACRPCGLHGHQQCPEGHFRCAVNQDARWVMGEI